MTNENFRTRVAASVERHRPILDRLAESELPDMKLVQSELTDEQGEWITDLHAMADYLETHPEFIPQYSGYQVFKSCYSYADDPTDERTEVLNSMSKFARALAPCEKVTTDTQFRLERNFGRHSIMIYADRDAVCTPTVVGKKTVTKRVAKVEAEYETVEEEVDDVEWDCPSLLGVTK